MLRSEISISRVQWAIVAMAVALLLPLPPAFAAHGSGGNNDGAYLGIQVVDLTPQKAASLRLSSTSGAVVEAIDHDGPACQAGIRVNDVIVAVAGKRIEGYQQLVQVVHDLSPGSVANVSILRDGQSHDIRVTLASRTSLMTPHSYPSPNNGDPRRTSPFVPGVPYSGDIEVPLVTPGSARRGIVVEPLTAQLGEYFGVPEGQGLLVRNVQKGSLGASAGLKAGDIIVKIDGQMIRDLADWRRSMHSGGKTSLSIIRDKREQTIDMVIPGPASDLRPGDDWDSVEPDVWAFDRQMPLLNSCSQSPAIATV